MNHESQCCWKRICWLYGCLGSRLKLAYRRDWCSANWERAGFFPRLVLIMDDVLSPSTVQDIRLAAKKLTSFKRREFQAEMAVKYCNSSARLAETRFGWDRTTVAKALGEKRTGIRCMDNYSQRGRKRTEEVTPEIKQAIVKLAEPLAQADPKFQTTLAYTRVTAAAVRAELLKDPQLAEHVPCRETVGAILNRLNYRIRTVKKTDPEKRSPRPTRSSPTSKSDAKRPPATINA